MFRLKSLLRPAIVVVGILLAAAPAGAANAPAGNPPSVAAGNPPSVGSPHTAAGPAAVLGCSRPGVPLCMDDGMTFVSADKMSGCQSEVKDYVDKTMAYLKCLNDENIATGHDLTRNIDRFNCRLSGRQGCN